MSNVTEMTTKELVDEYNTRTGKTIAKFSTRANGERQVQSLRTIELFEQSNKNKGGVFDSVAQKAKAVIEAKSVEQKPRKVKVDKKRPHHKVSVGGAEYSSTYKAFVGLKLQLSKHAKFRALLKRQGKAEFEGHKFTLVNG